MHDVNVRLRRDDDTKAAISEAAADHGDLRHKQGYPVEMLIEESRLLQVSIFTTLHNNVKHLEFSVTSPSFCTTASERVYITANGCEIGFVGTPGLQAAGAGGL